MNAFANFENALAVAVRAAQADGIDDWEIIAALQDIANEVELAPAFAVWDEAQDAEAAKPA